MHQRESSHHSKNGVLGSGIQNPGFSRQILKQSSLLRQGSLPPNVQSLLWSMIVIPAPKDTTDDSALRIYILKNRMGI
ncbi:hypothetical protein AKJ16_DCAP15568 [Drosera capensis]